LRPRLPGQTVANDTGVKQNRRFVDDDGERLDSSASSTTCNMLQFFSPVRVEALDVDAFSAQIADRCLTQGGHVR